MAPFAPDDPKRKAVLHPLPERWKLAANTARA